MFDLSILIGTNTTKVQQKLEIGIVLFTSWRPAMLEMDGEKIGKMEGGGGHV